MASLSSNRPLVHKALFGLSQALNFRRASRVDTGTVGQGMLETVANVIQHRTIGLQQTPDGRPLPRLKRKTIERKKEAGLDLRILVETGEMTSEPAILGRTTITSNVATMTAGVSEAVQWKVEFAEEGGDKRPVRHFFEEGKDGEMFRDIYMEKVLAQSVKDAENA